MKIKWTVTVTPKNVVRKSASHFTFASCKSKCGG